MSLAVIPQDLTDPTRGPLLMQVAEPDILSALLRDIRVTRSLQYCFESRGAWIVDATPAPFRPPGSVSFHVVVEGDIWIDVEQRFQVTPGDVLIFPRGKTHWIGSGQGGVLIDPGSDLPPTPWATMPVLRYAGNGAPCRIICGFIEARVLDFAPLLAALPDVMIARIGDKRDDWLAAAVRQLSREADRPLPGGLAITARLSEIIFIELLRREMSKARSQTTGWLSAVTDPTIQRALNLLHAHPSESWTQRALAASVGVSKTVLCARFQAMLSMSPMQYLREWRLYLASARLVETDDPIVKISEDAGYGSEATFSRAFSRSFGAPPARWRKTSGARQIGGG
ncbi:MAG: hypothetical protein JWS10_1248 [Cypionkella sp.]|uniref:AraC family transcriptional regulator n=1 Tax=Cypionkella sp. TaxID=2811411 RepID=UPI00260A293F|nr:AraC family transcriptional regulator [Cypionkella sp.]MDB5658633.1 hypothetical protein [Cypionkella sp.]